MFDKLSRNGEVIMEPKEMFWGALFGIVRDPYGVKWMINCELDPENSKKELS